MSDIFEFRSVPCPVCGSNDFQSLGYRGGDAHHSGMGEKTTIVRCLKCSHQYPNPMPFPVVSLGDLYAEPEEYFQRHDLEQKKKNGLELMAEFERRLGKKGSFLDVGSGRGELMWAAKESGWEFQGVDTSKPFIDFGRTHLGVEGFIGTLADAKFDDESFDAVTLGGIIEHLYSPAEVLREVHRLLRPGGWFFFDAPNEDGLYMVAGNAYMRVQGKKSVVVLAPTFAPFHVQGFNPKSLKFLLEATNFAVRDFDIAGEISPQMGEQSFRKKFEFRAAQLVNWLGNITGRGMYMTVWAQKK